MANTGGINSEGSGDFRVPLWKRVLRKISDVLKKSKRFSPAILLIFVTAVALAAFNWPWVFAKWESLTGQSTDATSAANQQAHDSQPPSMASAPATKSSPPLGNQRAKPTGHLSNAPPQGNHSSAPATTPVPVATSLPTGQPPKPPIPLIEKHADVVNLVYNDSTISDQSRSELINIVADATPTSSWRQVVTLDEDLTEGHLIRRIYGIDRFTDPISYETLISLICATNPHARPPYATGSTLRMPPLPPHSSAPAKSAAIRYQTTNTLLVNETTLSKIVEHDAAEASQRQINASFQARQVGQIIAIGLIDPTNLIQRALRTLDPVLPPGVHAIGNGAITTVRLLQDGAPPSQCNDNPYNWYRSSPYYSVLSTDLQELSADSSKREALKQSAKKTPLVILDWNNETTVHGKKVFAASAYALHQMSFDFLNPYITFVELNPRQQKSRNHLMSVLNDFASNFFCVQREHACKANGQGELEDNNNLLKSARSWLRNPDDAAWATDQLVDENPNDRTAFAIHDVVLWAVLWEYFRYNNPSVVNMSFSVLSSAVRIEGAQYLGSSHSMGLSAASDVKTAERLIDIPQNAATSNSFFLNVTSGSRTGQNLRGYSQLNSAVTVTALAPDCGYNFQLGDAIIHSDDSGTSFATPFVAALAWINFLRYGTDLKEMRHEIIWASEILPIAPALPIESEGVLDPARMLLKPESYLIDANSVAHTLKTATLRLNDAKHGDSKLFIVPRDSNVTVRLFSIGQQTIARIRTLTDVVNQEATPIDFILDDTSTFSAEDTMGNKYDWHTANEFLSKGREIGFHN